MEQQLGLLTVVIVADLAVFAFTRSKAPHVRRGFISAALFLSAAFAIAMAGSALADSKQNVGAYAAFGLAVVLAVAGVASWLRTRFPSVFGLR